MPAPLPLTVVVITLNEEQRLGDCLASVRGLTDDVVVVDAQSTDRTAEVAADAGAQVLTRAWTGYSDQKNFGNDAARHHWILSLDADERVTPELAAAIRKEFERGPRCDAYEIRFRNYFGASLVRFGAWNPESHVRLFDRRKLRWNSDEVHEGLRGVEGCKISKLPGDIRHLTVVSQTQLLAKTDRYSALFAEKLRRQRRHPSWWKIWLNPPFRFVRDYFLRGGVLDGRIGFSIAWESARYTHLKYWLARPEPIRVDGPRWSPLWATAMAVAMIALTVLITSGHRQPVEEPFAEGNSVIVGAVAVNYANDGFDNNSVAINLRLAVDDDVVL